MVAALKTSRNVALDDMNREFLPLEISSFVCLFGLTFFLALQQNSEVVFRI